MINPKNYPALLSLTPESPGVIQKMYRNYKGEESLRTLFPISLIFEEKNEYHGDNVWIVSAWDLDKKAMRDFCFTDFLGY